MTAQAPRIPVCANATATIQRIRNGAINAGIVSLADISPNIKPLNRRYEHLEHYKAIAGYE